MESSAKRISIFLNEGGLEGRPNKKIPAETWRWKRQAADPRDTCPRQGAGQRLEKGGRGGGQAEVTG